jgi:hypothetical protein
VTDGDHCPARLAIQMHRDAGARVFSRSLPPRPAWSHLPASSSWQGRAGAAVCLIVGNGAVSGGQQNCNNFCYYLRRDGKMTAKRSAAPVATTGTAKASGLFAGQLRKRTRAARSWHASKLVSGRKMPPERRVPYLTSRNREQAENHGTVSTDRLPLTETGDHPPRLPCAPCATIEPSNTTTAKRMVTSARGRCVAGSPAAGGDRVALT